MEYDYGIIGGGPAGYTTGMLLAQKGKTVIIFEKDKLGGTCLNKGCIPIKAILHASELYRETLCSSNIGLDISINSFDFSKVIEKKNQTVEKVRKALELAVKNSGAQVVYEKAEIKDKNTIVTQTNEYKVSEIVYAAGSAPKELKGLEFDHKFILSSDDVLELTKLPKSVLIIGSGAIGIEWARIFSNFKVEVYLSEIAEHLLPIADIEVSKRIERLFKQRKIKYFLNDSIDKIENNIVTLKSGTVIEPDFILSAAGRVPLKPDTEDCIILGDSCGEIQLAHYAISQAKNFAHNIAYDKTLIPSVIYGEPEIAWVGIKEQDCTEDYKKVTLPVTALGKSWCDDATDGFIKIITKDNFIKGAHIVSKEASALIHEILIAIENNITVDELKKISFAHPTYSEGIFEALMRI